MNHFNYDVWPRDTSAMGEVYFPVEGPMGNGFTLFRWARVPGGCVSIRVLSIMAALPKCLIGDMMADLIPTFGHHMIAGN